MHAFILRYHKSARIPAPEEESVFAGTAASLLGPQMGTPYRRFPASLEDIRHLDTAAALLLLH
jgi:hypothetical protein